MDGLFGLALTPRTFLNDDSNLVFGQFNQQNERSLYFHSLASDSENSVPLRIINNASLFEKNENAAPSSFKMIGKRGIQAACKFMSFKSKQKGLNNIFLE